MKLKKAIQKAVEWIDKQAWLGKTRKRKGINVIIFAIAVWFVPGIPSTLLIVAGLILIFLGDKLPQTKNYKKTSQNVLKCQNNI